MTAFFRFFIIEFKRLLSRRNLVLFLLFLFLSLYFVQEGINDYKRVIQNKENFQQVERINIEKFVNYLQYGTYGFRLLFIPSPLNILFTNSGAISELTAFVDSGVRLRIYNSFIGKNLYAERSGGFKDFFGIILLLGSLLSLFGGYDSLNHREYLKFMSSILSYKKVYFSIFWSRILLFNLFFLFTVGCALLLMLVNSVSLSTGEYLNLLIYLLVMILLFFFFSLLGILAGSIRSKSMGIVTIIILWFVFIFLLPGAVTKIVAKKADNITSAYNLEQEKLKILTDFEREVLYKVRNTANKEEREKLRRTLAENYWNTEFKVLQEIEKKMQSDINANLKYYQRLSLLFPSTFYFLVNNEISSRGYENFFNFYQYIQKLQLQFVRFYYDKRFYSAHGGIESFIKGEENVFYAKSRRPAYFLVGLLLTIFYIILLYIVSYSRFKKFLFVVPDKTGPDPNKLNLNINSGESVVLLTTADTIIDQLYNVYSGIARGFKGIVTLNKKNIVPEKNKKKEDFIYLCQPDKIPGNINAGDFINFFKKSLHIRGEEIQKFIEALNIKKLTKKRMNELEDKEKGSFLFALAQLKKCGIYIIHDFAKGISIDFIVDLKEQVKGLKAGGTSILYLSNDVLLATRIGDRVTYLLTDPSLPQCLDNYTTL
ncbi:ABC transporter permease subunit [Acidobacteriota bacterium]